MRYDAGSCDVAVVGAGHAGIEAALAAARLGLDTVCFTINMDRSTSQSATFTNPQDFLP